MDKEWMQYLSLIHKRPEVFMNHDELEIILDYDLVKDYEKKNNKKIGIIYQSPYHILLVDLVRDASHHLLTYERIIPTVPKGAVVSVPIYHHQYVLLHQYRHALRDYQYAFPRGFGEEDLSDVENLKKEIKEEFGADIIDYQYLGEVVADSGLCSTRVSIFQCTVENVEIHKDYEGIDDVILLDEDEMKAWISQNKINDGYTLAAYSLYKTINGKQ